jgi:hypothetical protein
MRTYVQGLYCSRPFRNFPRRHTFFLLNNTSTYYELTAYTDYCTIYFNFLLSNSKFEIEIRI